MTMDLIFPVRNIGFSKKKPSKFVTANKHNELCTVDFIEFSSMFFFFIFPFFPFFFSLENPNNNKTTKGLHTLACLYYPLCFTFSFFAVVWRKFSLAQTRKKHERKKIHFLLVQNN